MEKEEEDKGFTVSDDRRGVMGEGVTEGGLGGKLLSASILISFGAEVGAALTSTVEAANLRRRGERRAAGSVGIGIAVLKILLELV